MSRWRWAAPVLILLVALILRTHAIADDPLWLDEGLTLVIARFSAGELISGAIDPTGPLYYMLHGWLLPPSLGPAGQRLLSLACGLAVVALLLELGRRMGGKQVGLIAAALGAVSLPLIHYAQEARAYSLLLVLLLLSAIGLVAWAQARRRGETGAGGLLLFGGASVLAWSTQFVAIFWIAPAVLWLLVSAARDPRAARPILVTLAGMALLALPETIRLWRAASADLTYDWLDQPGLGRFLKLTGAALLPLRETRGSAAVEALTTVLMLVPVAALAAAAWLRPRGAARRWMTAHPTETVVLAIFLATPLMVWLFGAVVQPILTARSILAASLGSALLLALVIGRLPGGRAKTLLAVGTILAFVPASLIRPQPLRQAYDEAARALAERARPGDLVLFCPTVIYPAFRHAVGPLGVPALALTRSGTAAIESGVGSDPRWADRYAHLFTDPLGRSLRSPERARPHTASGRIWLVTVAPWCRDRAQLRRWLGPGPARLAHTAGASRPDTAIQLWEIRPVGSRTIVQP